MTRTSKIARDLLNEAGELEAAKALIAGRLAAILQTDGETIVSEALQAALHHEWSGPARYAAWKRPAVLASGELSTPSARLRGGIERTLLEYPMANGRPLRTYTYDELVSYANEMQAQGDTMILRSRWFTLVAKEIKGTNKPVGDVLKHSDLDRLKRRAEKHVAAA